MEKVKKVCNWILGALWTLLKIAWHVADLVVIVVSTFFGAAFRIFFMITRILP